MFRFPSWYIFTSVDFTFTVFYRQKLLLSPRSIVRLALRNTTFSPYAFPTPSMINWITARTGWRRGIFSRNAEVSSSSTFEQFQLFQHFWRGSVPATSLNMFLWIVRWLLRFSNKTFCCSSYAFCCCSRRSLRSLQILGIIHLIIIKYVPSSLRWYVL